MIESLTVPGRVALRVLVADDEPTLRAALRGLVRLMGHRVDAVSDGAEAVEAVAAREYDVVLLDVQMPGMGGFEAARRIRGHAVGGAGPRLVGISGEPEEPAAYRPSGMDDFLVKPILRAHLARALGPAVLS